ncbi:hypothetical protein AGLY_004317 [Aphis glycines]|uniref:Uncharacterized protein n=1 Tax=Aphis glycines TaxID=307491 RepID=A0A6G0TXR2_APHGL|nr:hypothetical protein AGLY_004317 [Aphis glycines]
MPPSHQVYLQRKLKFHSIVNASDQKYLKLNRQGGLALLNLPKWHIVKSEITALIQTDTQINCLYTYYFPVRPIALFLSHAPMLRQTLLITHQSSFTAAECYRCKGDISPTSPPVVTPLFVKEVVPGDNLLCQKMMSFNSIKYGTKCKIPECGLNDTDKKKKIKVLQNINKAYKGFTYFKLIKRSTTGLPELINACNGIEMLKVISFPQAYLILSNDNTNDLFKYYFWKL